MQVQLDSPIDAVCVSVNVQWPDSPACRAQVVPRRKCDALAPGAPLVGEIFVMDDLSTLDDLTGVPRRL